MLNENTGRRRTERWGRCCLMGWKKLSDRELAVVAVAMTSVFCVIASLNPGWLY